MSARRAILIIYTGGTIGMQTGTSNEGLVPVHFSELIRNLPELSLLDCDIDHLTLEPPKDSSSIEADDWLRLRQAILDRAETYFGFVVLHGTDTMSFSASMLSFLLLNLRKPIVFTGSQLPLGTLRTDAKENLITAIEIASAIHHDAPLLQEVAIYFEYKLYRANRSTKVNAHHFKAFDSPNYPWLMRSGVHMEIQYDLLLRPTADWRDEFENKTLKKSVYVLKLYPNIPDAFFEMEFPNAEALILETFGSGNSMERPSLISFLNRAAEQKLPIINVSQCLGGSVEMGRYASSNAFVSTGVINGRDMTTEAAMAKAHYLVALETSYSDFKSRFETPLCGEISLK